ncbi:MAG TPA: hypothetical protein PLJ37_02510 [Chitinophagales bacterium]|nr:hypothetical protein [Chitinophagales bacterium]MCB9074760.1 hypothetical protein [Chitinophagales bacterium]HMV03006.1 hypothetical protein [Chitinophagales bacterium]HMY42261.1 hypothetical protein [Chitinophagales bacterium]HMZ93674.1 hypothetical protein [Chitinophagales bacterium]
MKKTVLTFMTVVAILAMACEKKEENTAKLTSSFTTSVDSVVLQYGVILVPSVVATGARIAEQAGTIILTNNSVNADSYVWELPNGETIETTSKDPIEVTFHESKFKGLNCGWDNNGTITLKAKKGTTSSTSSKVIKLYNTCF